MSIEPTFEEQMLLADTFRRARTGMTRRELFAEMVAAVTFLAGVAAIWAARSPRGVDLAPALICVVVLALATLVRFETPFGFTVPTQLAFVPLLFAAPVALTPLLTAAALGLGRLPDVVRGQLPAGRLLQTFGNAWFALGPATVFALAGTEPSAAGAPLLLAALAAQFAADFVASARFAVGRGSWAGSQLRDSWVYVIDAALSGVGLEVAKNIHAEPLAALTLLPLLGLLSMFARERHHRLEGLLELNTAYRGTALVLGEVVEADDNYTGAHCRGVVSLALEFADRLDLTAEQRRNLEFGALLHDVGKIAIPKTIINKPGRLDPEEWTVIKTHTLEGQKMLDRVGGFMREVGQIVRSHHERWDGTGYPDGLAGEAIPLESRVISCCDTWNAMRTDRPYRKALSHEVALAELWAIAGSQLDPRLVELFVEIVDVAEPVVRTSRAKAPGQAAAALLPPGRLYEAT